MSASLVGSEMCIRDRYLASPSPAPCQNHQNIASTSPKPPVPRQHLAHTSPVSYTHLTLPTICSV
eukprot:9160222-Alexandrium_andersonii.AAC.1